MKAILFDFADTLASGQPCWEWPQIVACQERGIVVSPAAVKGAIWRVWMEREGCAHPDASRDQGSYAAWIEAIESAILRELGLFDGLSSAVQRVMHLQAAPSSYAVFPEVPRALAELRAQGLRLAIVSNNGWWLPDLVAGLGLADLVDVTTTSARVGFRKPRPEIFAVALDALGVERSEALFVGDDYQNDVLGARAAGLRGVLVDRRGRAPGAPDTITDLRDLASWSSSPDASGD